MFECQAPGANTSKTAVRLRRPFATLCSCALALLVVGFAADNRHASAAGWSPYTNSSPAGGTGTTLTLSDGTIMVQGADSKSWSKLTPDSTGSYANGTWSSMASMGTARLYFASNVLPSGKVFVVGGEYSGSTLASNWTNTGEIYDPVANTWTPITSFPQSNFGDDPSVVLPNGNILCGFVSGPQTYFFNPSTLSWITGPTKLRNDRSDEETWVLLPDGSVLSYDVFASDSNNAGSAQRYNPATNTWVDAGSVPVILTTGASQGSELGPGMLLPDGRVIQVGANENIVFYTPSTNSWSTIPGVSLPAGMGSDDAPGALLPNGHFLFLADSYLFNAPTKLFDFDYSTNTLTDITLTLPTNLAADLASGPAYYRRMMITPDGHLMLGTGSNTWWDYAPTGSPSTTWAPTISGITNSSNVYTLTGTRLTGISQGASYGDDVESDSNYPLIRLTGPSPATTVTYARSFNWTPGVSSANSTTSSTVQFTLPAGLASGTYQLSVVANGIASPSVSFTPSTTTSTNNYVSSAYTSGNNTLTLKGDAGANTITITASGKQLTVKGVGSTKIGSASSSAQQVTYTIKSNVIISGDFTASATPPTNDSVSITSVAASKITLKFGTGADSTTLTLCTVGTLTVDGGANPTLSPDTVTLISTKITNPPAHYTNIP